MSWKFYYKPGLELKRNTTRQILILKKYNALDFELNIFLQIRFWIEKTRTR